MADDEPRYILEEYQQQQNEAAGILPPDKRPPPLADTIQANDDTKPSEKPSEKAGGGSTASDPKRDAAVDNFNDHYYRFNSPPTEEEEKKKPDGTAPIKGAVEPEFDAPSTKDIKLDAATGSNTIKVGDTLGPNDELVSDNGRYAVRFQDGNLVFVDKELGQKALQSGTENGTSTVTGARFDKDSIDILGGQHLVKGDKGRALWSQGFEFDKSIADKITAYRINDDGTIVALGGKDNKEILGVAYHLGDQKKHFIPVDFPVPPGGSEFFYDTVETMRRIMQLQVDTLGSGKPSAAPDPLQELKNAGLPSGEFTSEMVDVYRNNHEKIESLNLALDKRLKDVKILTKDLANEVRDAKNYIVGKLDDLGQVMRSPMWASARPWGQSLEELEEEKKTRVQRTYDEAGNVTSFELSKELEQKLLDALRSTSMDISKRIDRVNDVVGKKPPKDPDGTPKGDPSGSKDDGKGNGNGGQQTTPSGTPQGPGAPGPAQTGPGPNQDWSGTYNNLPAGANTPGGGTGQGATDPKLAKFFNDLANDIEKIGSGAGGGTGDGGGSGGGTGSSGGETPGGQTPGGQTPGGQDNPGGQNQPGTPPGGTGQPPPQPGQQQGGGLGNLALPLMMMLGTLPQMIGQAAQMMMAQKAEQEERERYEEERRLEREERKADEEEATAQASASAPDGGAPAPGEAAPPVATASYGPGAPPPVVMPGGMIDAPLPDGTTQKVPSAVAQALNKEVYNVNGSDAQAAYAGTTGQQTPSNPWLAVDPNTTDPDKKLRTGDVIQWENRSALVVMNESGLNVLLNGQLVQLDPHNPPDDGHGPFGRFQGFFHPSGIDKAGGDLTAGAQPTVDVAPGGGAPPQPKPVRPQVYT
ncbi:hypothetical protein [Nocardia cyriacigeorgica]|uniref:hypothetical protein n=1 Tax=Nocardia cyriacigeorgica TaxID=135487 RepID=UPI001893E43B|nr:hypothetical protein [Nocardia cyriacigeorgica]MBF6324905.1 hypothetical protein [Nocardia cyriacigeorgica]MBF6496056.1 hypothetical protein [Nocardia cyriacigeorgica]